MKQLVPQHSFPGNPSYLTKKTCLISSIAQCITNDYVQSKQVEGGADRLIVLTDLEVSNPVLVIATDTGSLVMQASGTHGGFYGIRRGLASCLNVLHIQEKIGTHKACLLFNNAVYGCESVQVFFEKGKKTMLRNMNESLGNVCCPEAFINITKRKPCRQLEKYYCSHCM